MLEGLGGSLVGPWENLQEKLGRAKAKWVSVCRRPGVGHSSRPFTTHGSQSLSRRGHTGHVSTYVGYK